MRSLLIPYLNALIGDRAHDHNCDPEDGRKPSTDCERCLLEHAVREMELDAHTITRQSADIAAYREAGAISSLEVMPAPPAVERCAAFLRDWDEGGRCSAWASIDEREREDWRVLARQVLRAATGLDRPTSDATPFAPLPES